MSEKHVRASMHEVTMVRPEQVERYGRNDCHPSSTLET